MWDLGGLRCFVEPYLTLLLVLNVLVALKRTSRWSYKFYQHTHLFKADRFG